MTVILAASEDSAPSFHEAEPTPTTHPAGSQVAQLPGVGGFQECDHLGVAAPAGVRQRVDTAPVCWGRSVKAAPSYSSTLAITSALARSKSRRSAGMAARRRSALASTSVTASGLGVPTRLVS